MKRDGLKPFGDVDTKHCKTCAKFHSAAPGLAETQGYCVAHPPQPHIVGAAPSINPALVPLGPKNPMKPAVQAFYPAVDENDGCWEHVEALDAKVKMFPNSPFTQSKS